MGYTYNQFVVSLANLLVVQPSDPYYLTVLPNILDDAELRIYRELDLLSTVTTDATSAFSSGNRTFTLPTTANGRFVVTEQINVITPASALSPETGTRNGLVPTSREYLDAVYGSSTGSGVPQYFAMLTQNTIIVGPWPDAAYRVEVVGTIRPNTLSSANPTTILSEYFPDLLLAAACVFGAGYQKNFSDMGDQPQAPAAWEAHYQSLLRGAAVEEFRKKFGSQGWTSKQPNPIATPPRT